jgi:hypothetical protein
VAVARRDSMTTNIISRWILWNSTSFCPWRCFCSFFVSLLFSFVFQISFPCFWILLSFSLLIARRQRHRHHRLQAAQSKSKQS